MIQEDVMSIDQTDKAKYKALYLQTAREYVHTMQQHIGLLLQKTETNDSIATVHRSAHSLASQSLVMEYTNIGEYARAIEKIFRLEPGEKFTVDRKGLEMIEHDLKKIVLSLDAIENDKPEIDLSADIALLEKEI